MRTHGRLRVRATPGYQRDRLAEARALLDSRDRAPANHSASRTVLDGPGLALQAGTHEWFAAGTFDRRWIPPLAVLIGLAHRAMEGGASGRVVWIGRRCWAYPNALVRRRTPDEAAARRLLNRSGFVDPPGHAERVWAIEQALRCPGVSVVIADAGAITMPESRRLQLASTAGDTAGMLARPASEQRALSACKARWVVTPEVSQTRNQRWSVRLSRCKGAQPTGVGGRGIGEWIVERDHATGAVGKWETRDVDLDARVVGGPGAPARSEADFGRGAIA